MSKRRILVVEDEQLISYALSTALRGDGVEVRAVGSAEEALFEMEANCYDLCFLDRRLPGLDGLDALEHIRRCSPETKVIFMTAVPLTLSEQEKVDLLADSFMEKPFDLDRVRALTYEVLSGGSRYES